MVVLGHAAKMHNGSRSAFLQPPKNLFGSARRNAYSCKESQPDLAFNIMLRQLSILTLVAVLVACAQPEPAQPRPSPQTPQAALDEASRLNKQVEKLYGEGKYGEAVPDGERALALREKALGAMHPDVAESLNNLAELYRAQGAYPKAEPLLVRALDIREKTLGPIHPDVAGSLNGLAELYQAQGAYAKAEPLYVRALDIREKALGPMHPDVATSLNNLGEFYQAQGAYLKTEPLLVRALDIREKALGPMHPRVATSLNNLAALYEAQGAYAKADLLRLAAHRASRSPAMMVAGPDYGPRPSHPVPGTMSFRPLPGVRAEAADLGRYFSTPPLTDKQATKEALAALIGPTILHVATHGFYARDPGTALVPGSRGPSAPPPTASVPPAPRGIHVEIDGDMSSLSPPAPSSDPTESLDWSGLAMAGANQGAGGIVTAREIAGFDWWGTQLVVLSACQTGVGALASGDGVYGMRRALVLAGAESQVVSLWNVNDSSARLLMRDYYGELSRGTGRAEALRQAKLNMLHQPHYTHP